MTATVHKFRAGPLPSVDSRRECRLSSDVIADLIALESARRNEWMKLAPKHTMCPPEREYAERYSKDRSLFWLLAGPASAGLVLFCIWRAL